MPEHNLDSVAALAAAEQELARLSTSEHSTRAIYSVLLALVHEVRALRADLAVQATTPVSASG